MGPSAYTFLGVIVGGVIGVVGTLGKQGISRRSNQDTLEQGSHQLNAQLEHERKIKDLERADELDARAYEQYVDARDRAINGEAEEIKDAALVELNAMRHDPAFGKYMGWAAGVVDLMAAGQAGRIEDDQHHGDTVDAEESPDAN